MHNERKEAAENRVIERLTESTRSLCGINLEVTDYPDRHIGSRAPVQGGCDAIISGLEYKIALEIAEVPISPNAYGQDAKIQELRAVVVPLLQRVCPGQQVDIVIDVGTVVYAFHRRDAARINRVAKSIAERILSVPLASGLTRYEEIQFFLDDGMRFTVNRKASEFPFVAVSCGLVVVGGADFAVSFKEVLEKKRDQFKLYRGDHLLCIALWSSDIERLSHKTVVSAFSSCGVDLSEIDSVWFVGGGNLLEVYPLLAYDLDCRNDAGYIEDFYFWWPENPVNESRPFEKIPQRFGQRPIASRD